METIWNHNVTKEELKQIFGSDRWDLETLTEFNQFDHYGLIYLLYYHIRNDKEKAKIYADKIPNTFGKVFGICYHDFIRKKP